MTVCEKEAENPPCAGAVLRADKVLDFQALQGAALFCYQGRKGPKF